MKKLLLLASWIGLFFIYGQCDAQKYTIYEYAVKFVCGKADSAPVAQGIYYTAINIHNPNSKHVSFSKVFSVAKPGVPGKITSHVNFTIGPNQSVEIDCDEIQNGTQIDGFVKGFVIIECDFELNVVAVYTAADNTGNTPGQVRTLDVVPVSARKHK